MGDMYALLRKTGATKTEIEEMGRWERNQYVNMLEEEQKEREREMEQQKQQASSNF